MAANECPMCGETMQKQEREIVVRVPGRTSEVKHAKLVEWVCPECDYFEEAEEGTTKE